MLRSIKVNRINIDTQCRRLVLKSGPAEDMDECRRHERGAREGESRREVSPLS